jgi:hypothetical protein
LGFWGGEALMEARGLGMGWVTDHCKGLAADWRQTVKHDVVDLVCYWCLGIGVCEAWGLEGNHKEGQGRGKARGLRMVMCVCVCVCVLKGGKC